MTMIYDSLGGNNHSAPTQPKRISPIIRKKIVEKLFLAGVIAAYFAGIATANADECIGYSGPGGPCYSGPGGGLYAGPGGGQYAGPGGGKYAGPGGGLYSGPGGGMYRGPGGGLYNGPGGGLYNGPGGGSYNGPPQEGDDGAYHGPVGPCITGQADHEWLVKNCPNRR